MDDKKLAEYVLKDNSSEDIEKDISDFKMLIRDMKWFTQEMKILSATLQRIESKIDIVQEQTIKEIKIKWIKN